MGGGEVSEGGGATKFAKIRENAKIHPILQCSIKEGSERDQINSKRGEAWGLVVEGGGLNNGGGWGVGGTCARNNQTWFTQNKPK